MSVNLLDSVKDLINNEMLGKARASLGETEEGIKRGLGAAIPSVLAGILNKAGSGGAGELLNMAKNAWQSGIPGNSGELSGGGGGGSTGHGMMNQAGDLLRGVFGDKVNNLVNMISGFSGIKESSASSLLNMAAPASLGVLGRQVTENNLTPSGLISYLNTQKDNILNSIPSGFNLSGALGLASLGSIGSKLAGAIPDISAGAKELTTNVSSLAKQGAGKVSGGTKWVAPLLLAVVLIGLIWYFMKGCDSQTPVASEETGTMRMPPAATPAETPEQVALTLPGGAAIYARKGGVEEQLINFLNDPSTKGSKDAWFDFDNLNFKTGSAELTDESRVQVGNLVAILNAYPRLKVKIGGYTDKTGDSLTNLQLSQQRADAVVKALQTEGAGASQVLGAEGYGLQFAHAAADAPDEQRKLDRRIALCVREK